MINEARIREELGNVLEDADFPGLAGRISGKVRDSYVVGDKRILVTTDRISAFDRILGTIPFKGQVLNQMAAFWFEKTRGTVPNHVLDVPDPNIMVVSECGQLPLEFIVRGYITGVTKTSAWTHYSAGGRNLCGNVLPEGLRKDQKLKRPILTPTTKHEEHDRNISRAEAIAEGLIDGATFDAAAEICMKLYDAGVRHAARQGLILVDTKYEIGTRDGRLVVSDEVHTPDSSRYWFADTYQELFDRGGDQRKLDKEYVREWLAARGFRGDGPAPALPDTVRIEAARRYIQVYEQVTGLPFQPVDQPIRDRVRQALERIL